MPMSLDLAKLYETQISLTEWLAGMDHDQAEAMRVEDNEKRERLRVLNRALGLPFDEPIQFAATDITTHADIFENYLAAHADDLCALRLIPRDPTLPKLRMRGMSVRDVVTNWFPAQGVDPEKYRAEIIPHSDNQTWSTIFIVNERGAYGEIIRGKHSQLTQGFYEKEPPITFAYNFSHVSLSQDNDEARAHVHELLAQLHVEDCAKQDQLQSELGAEFAHDFLCGYFETTTSPEFGIWFCDYNRILGKLYGDFDIRHTTHADALHGQTGSVGVASGRVRIVNDPQAEFEDGEILVCQMTTPQFLPLMRRAAAIVTEQGGILTHAAIVARELKIPCVTGVKHVTEILHTGDTVVVDATRGSIERHDN